MRGPAPPGVPLVVLAAIRRDPRPCRALVEMPSPAPRRRPGQTRLTPACPVCRLRTPPGARDVEVVMAPCFPIELEPDWPWAGYCGGCRCLFWTRNGYKGA
jgi:hypothetical protein